MPGLRYLEGVTTLELDPEKCTGCGMCVMVCPHAVFEIEDARARIVDRDACIECGACALNCKPGAVTVGRLRRRHHPGQAQGHRAHMRLLR